MRVIIFFFKQKTAYEMRISDWSSDVCSSDLIKVQVRLVSGKKRCLDISASMLSGSPIMAYLPALREFTARLLARVPAVCGLCHDSAYGGQLCGYCYQAVTQSIVSGPLRCPVCQLALDSQGACPDCTPP